MSDSQQAHPAAETPETDEPTPGPSLEGKGEIDPEIEALLDFEPVPRKVAVEGGWSPEMQRAFIARLALHGSACKACEELDKNRIGATKLYRSPRGASLLRVTDLFFGHTREWLWLEAGGSAGAHGQNCHQGIMRLIRPSRLAAVSSDPIRG